VCSIGFRPSRGIPVLVVNPTGQCSTLDHAEDVRAAHGAVGERLRERDSVALKADQLAALATVFGASVDYLIGQEPAKERKGGPVGRAKLSAKQNRRGC
jgi:hypothetical protein